MRHERSFRGVYEIGGRSDFGNRMTIIRLSNGELFLHSPVKLSAELVASVRQLGDVSFIVTPNNFHGLFVEDWILQFPHAKHYSAKDKISSSTITLTEDIDGELLGEIKTVKIAGAPRVNEFAFIHRSSGTLILTDIAFNIGEKVSTWSKIFFTLNGAYGKFGPSRLMKSMVEDASELSVSIRRIAEFDFVRIIVSHGSII